MSDHFRFSPRPNRASEIHWQRWTAEAFDDAEAGDRPIFLNLTTVWCRACHELDETTLSNDAVIALLNEDLVPIRVDGDRQPHIQYRYIAGGWPTCALLAPTGEVFWSGTLVGADELTVIVRDVLAAWRDRREELASEIERRRRAMEASRSRRSSIGIVRREAADDVLSGAQEQFDARNGGFGDAPKFIHAEAVELLLTQGERQGHPDWVAMAERTLDGMLAGEIEDPVEGGFFHYALAADWTRPQVEKLLTVNARVLTALAYGAARSGRDDWLAAAVRTADWVERTLSRDGLWGGSQHADPLYFAADGDARRELDPPPVDGTVYTDANAMWITALAEAGARLDRPEWVVRASAALDLLLDTMAADDGTLHHHRAPGAEPVSGLLGDLVHGARAALAVSLAAERDDALQRARGLVAIMEGLLWDDSGGFLDHRPGPASRGALRFRDRPFEENALAARLLLTLARRTGERSYRAMAESVLALLSPMAGRYAVEGATFALAVEEFFALRSGR